MGIIHEQSLVAQFDNEEDAVELFWKLHETTDNDSVGHVVVYRNYAGHACYHDGSLVEVVSYRQGMTMFL